MGSQNPEITATTDASSWRFRNRVLVDLADCRRRQERVQFIHAERRKDGNVGMVFPCLEGRFYLFEVRLFYLQQAHEFLMRRFGRQRIIALPSLKLRGIGVPHLFPDLTTCNTLTRLTKHLCDCSCRSVLGD